MSVTCGWCQRRTNRYEHIVNCRTPKGEADFDAVREKLEGMILTASKSQDTEVQFSVSCRWHDADLLPLFMAVTNCLYGVGAVDVKMWETEGSQEC